MFLRPFLTVLLISMATPALAQGNVPGNKPPAAPTKKTTVTAAMPTPDDRAKQWLILVDDKNYAQSWSEAGKAFQNRQKTDAWAKDAGVRRAPLGAVASRNLKSIDLSKSNIAVIRYDSVFAHKASAVETVTLTFENGGWVVTDYTVS
jgi:hypothetical protein